MHINLEDPYLVDKIVSEVKSQGVFDQFRRDCMSDVDTKPAYQNLRQRVEISVGKFLSEQIWTPDTNKIQLREKLRKHVTESGFLDTGVERIVDQVVNPKISTTFQPQIEDIAYKYLGIEKPEDSEETTSSYTNGNLSCEVDLMPTDLEAVSPDSDKATNKSNEKSDMNDSDEKVEDEEESPPFEPLEGRPPSPEEEEEQSNESKLSAISGLTSQDSVKSGIKSFSFKPTEECQLSQVSSSSHLSILSNDGEEYEIMSKQPGNDISEEAQMPKFFENSDVNESKSLHFDINKDEIKFEGTERGSAVHSLSLKSSLELEVDTTETNQSERTSQNSYSEFPNSSTSDNDDSEKPLKIMTDVSQSDSIVLCVMDKIRTNEEVSKCSNNNQDKLHSHSPTLKIESSNENIQKVNTDNDAKKSKHHDNDTKGNDYSTNKDRRSSRKDKHRSSSLKSKSESNSKSEKSSGNEKDGDNTKQKRTKEKTEKISDDHFSSKQKIMRRKSTDSNDGDNIADDYKHSRTLGNTSNILTESTNNSKLSDIGSNSSNSNIGTSAQSSSEKKSHSVRCEKLRNTLRPVILDKFFNNNSIHSVELAIGGKLNSNCLQINHQNMFRSVHNETIEEKCENVDEYNIFEWDLNEKEDFEIKYRKLSAAIEKNEYNVYISCVDEGFIQIFKYFSMHVIEIKNNFDRTNFDSEISLRTKFHKNTVSDTFDVPDNKFLRLVEGKNKRKINGQAFTSNKRKRFSGSSSISSYIINNEQVYNSKSSNLINNYTKNIEIVNKKFKSLSHEYHENVLSTNSDLCFGSKENDCSTSDTDRIKRDTTVSPKDNILMKNNQRYSSEDLYKPRLALCQRSRRRGVDTCDF